MLKRFNRNPQSKFVFYYQRIDSYHWLFAILFLLVSVSHVGCSRESTEREPSAPQQLRRGLGNGSSGPLTVTAANTILNRYSALARDARAGDRSLVLDPVTQGVTALLPLAPGDQLLIIQTQGAIIETNNELAYGTVLDLLGAGRFELARVAGYEESTNTVLLTGGCGGLKNSYSASGRTQVIFVPQYSELTLAAAGTITAPRWDGRTGGVVAIMVQGAAILNGRIEVSGTGFRGGEQTAVPLPRLPGIGSFYYALTQADGGSKGESIAGPRQAIESPGAYGRGAPSNGGGGGNRLLAGGGGGANGGSIAIWNGQGVMNTSGTFSTQIWGRDPAHMLQNRPTTSSGGGRGGYTLSGAALSPTLYSPADPAWQEDSRRERGGLGGRPVPNDPRARLFLGGGGGSGDDYLSTSGAGGAGGGLIYLLAERVSGSGVLLANGSKGGSTTATVQAGAGGGGAGGTVIVAADSMQGVRVQATGGIGGTQGYKSPPAAGPGGGGGGGYVALPPSTNVSVTVSGGKSGTSLSDSMIAFQQNGATDGGAGVREVLDTTMSSPPGFCSDTDLAVTLSTEPQEGQSEVVKVFAKVENRGPGAVVAATLLFELPADVEVVATESERFTCTPDARGQSCRISGLPAGSADSLTLSLRPAFGALAVSGLATLSAELEDPVPENNSGVFVIELGTSVRGTGGGLGCAVSSQSGGRNGVWFLFCGLALSVLIVRIARRERSARCGSRC